MMEKLCAQCNICGFVDMQREDTSLKLSRTKGDSPLVLVIGDAMVEGAEEVDLLNADAVLGDIPYTYTRVVRCEHGDPELFVPSDYAAALSRCSVWTHNLLEDRAVILTVEGGLKQMGIEGKKIGDIFRSAKYGVVAVVESYRLDKYKAQIQRALREAGIHV